MEYEDEDVSPYDVDDIRMILDDFGYNWTGLVREGQLLIDYNVEGMCYNPPHGSVALLCTIINRDEKSNIEITSNIVNEVNFYIDNFYFLLLNPDGSAKKDFSIKWQDYLLEIENPDYADYLKDVYNGKLGNVSKEMDEFIEKRLDKIEKFEESWETEDYNDYFDDDGNSTYDDDDENFS